MPTAATTANGGSNATQRQSNNNAPAAVVPFVRASSHYAAGTGTDVTKTMGSSDVDFGLMDVPAYGYVRSLVVLVEGTGAAAGSATVAGATDSPWNVLKNIALTEPNGAVIANFTGGYQLFLANKWGGYKSVVGANPESSPVFSDVDTDGNFKFLIRIPVELNLRDGLGSLANQDAASTFKVRLTLAKSGDVYGTAPDTLPSVRVRTYLEAWEQPEGSTAGQANATMPPALGTTQFWSEQVLNVSKGQQTLQLKRVGNYIRNLILVYRDTDGARTDSNWPDTTTVALDTAPLSIRQDDYWKSREYEVSGYGLDSGVRVLPFDTEFDGTLGRENADLWLPTLSSTRLELLGDFGAAGTLTVLTNDVAISGPVFI
jgi:hypothetical protein